MIIGLEGYDGPVGAAYGGPFGGEPSQVCGHIRDPRKRRECERVFVRSGLGQGRTQATVGGGNTGLFAVVIGVGLLAAGYVMLRQERKDRA